MASDINNVPASASENGLRSRFVGDFLLAFGFKPETAKTRMNASSWREEAEGPGWTLLCDSPTAGWKGFPMSKVSVLNWNFWLLGELFPALPTADDLTKLLLETTKAIASLNALNGHFLLIARDSRSNEWHLSTDRFGTLHAYYGNDGRHAAVGTFFPAVAEGASKRTFDWDGIYGFFTTSFFPGERTYFKDIQILRPRSHYVFSGEGELLKKTPYWEWYHVPSSKRSYEQTVHEFGEVFGKVLNEQAQDGRIAVPISGGLDSRSTIAALDRGGPEKGHASQIWSYSYGYSDDSVETRIAGEIARKKGLPFEAFTITPYLFKDLSFVLDTVEGFQDITQSRQAAVVGEIAQHADYLIAAHWGDVWMDDMGLKGSRGTRSGPDEAAVHALAKLRKPGGEWFGREIRAPGDWKREGEELLRNFALDHMQQLDAIEDPDFRLKAFKTESWSFRWTSASLRMFQPAAFPRLPFYDSRLCDFFCTVPTDFVRGRRLQIDYLKRHAPDLARVAWQVYDADLYTYKYFNSLLLPKRALKKLWRMVARRHVIQRNWEVQFLNASGRENMTYWLLRRGLRLHEFLPPASVRTLLDEFYASPDASHGYIVSMLLTFSAWLEHHG